MYLAKYEHGELQYISLSRVRSDIEFARMLSDKRDQGYTPITVLKNYVELKCTDRSCKYAPCCVISEQGDMPTIPSWFVIPK